MDKYEYKVRADEIEALIREGEYAEAVAIADTIDWRRVKSVRMLCTISDLYKINRRFQESKDILLLAYEKHPSGRLIVYSLCELSIKMEEYVQAIEYYKEFAQIAPRDTSRYILQYRLYEAQEVSLEERIAVLEEFKKRDYREKWAYELAYLYHRIGLTTKCVEECDEMYLWFGEGKYVLKALELKQLHTPLNADQKAKYDAWIASRDADLEEDAEKYPPEEEAAEPETEEDVEEEEERYPEDEDRDDSDFMTMPTTDLPQVKTVDVGEYNTLNLQMALAESMREIMTEEEEDVPEPPMQETRIIGMPQEAEEAADAGDNIEEPSIVEKIIAPLLQETSEMPGTALFQDTDETQEESLGDTREYPALKVAESVAEQPVIREVKPEPAAEQPAAREVRPEPAAEQPVIREVRPEPAAEQPVIREVRPEPAVEQPVIREVRPEPAAEQPVIREVKPEPAAEQPVVSEVKPESIAEQPERSAAPTPYDHVLSQEYDGQIRLLVPDTDVRAVEKQITGQLSIEDIMAEWEAMKKSNEQKRMEDVRQRILEHTGSLFEQFDEATKSGLLEQLEKAFVAAIMKESGKSERPGIRKVVLPEDIEEEPEVKVAKPPAASEETGPKAVVREIIEEPVYEEAEPEEEEIEEEIDDEIEEVSEPEVQEEPENRQDEIRSVRELTDEERELFGQFVQHRKPREQLIHTLDNMSMASYTGNVIITGEEEEEALSLAKGLIREMQYSDSNFSGKIAKISGAVLNKKDIAETLSRISNGALIIEKAADMKAPTIAKLRRELEKYNVGLFLILEDNKQRMNGLLSEHEALQQIFDLRIDIEPLDNEALVAYARQYAEDMEYSIDEFGVLALHTRIAEMQTSDHEVTLAEVRELVDEAIYYANRKTPKHFVDVLLSKRYDDDDMIILRESDFIHY